jgi:predicted acetyltransferase
MEPELRTITPDEIDAWVTALGVPFLEVGDEAMRAHWTPAVEPDRAWAVVDRGRLVATSCTFTRNVTVPGLPGQPCPVVPLTAVSGVGVHPTHRRRGLLRRMMDAMVADGRSRGEPVAGLLASEAGIYGRFGFGLATTSVDLVIDARAASLRTAVADAGLCLMDAGEAAKVLPGLHDRLRRGRPGQVDRPERTWEGLIADLPAFRDGGSARMYAVGDDGYVAYQAHETSDGHLHRARLVVRDLYGATPEIEAALWQFVCAIDLVDEVRAQGRPVDDPLRWRLTDPRQLKTVTAYDRVWIRILDVPAALGARAYGGDGRLVLAVTGDDPLVAGRWVLDAGTSSCAPAEGEGSDLTLGADDLGAIYLGGVAPSTLAAAGRIREDRPGALALADHLFVSRPAPFAGTGF